VAVGNESFVCEKLAEPQRRTISTRISVAIDPASHGTRADDEAALARRHPQDLAIRLALPPTAPLAIAVLRAVPRSLSGIGYVQPAFIFAGRTLCRHQSSLVIADWRSNNRRKHNVKKLLTCLGGAALLTFAVAYSADAAPGPASTLPELQSFAGSTVTPAHCRRYRHCHRRGWRRHRRCHRC